MRLRQYIETIATKNGYIYNINIHFLYNLGFL